MHVVCEAAEAGDLPQLTTLLAQGGDVNARGKNGNSALAFACANGHADCCSLLLRKGANVNQLSDWGNTPLHAACWAESIKCIRQLLSAKAHIDFQSSSGPTPLHMAVHGGRAEAVTFLVRNGASRTLLWQEKTPLALAHDLQHSECAAALA